MPDHARSADPAVQAQLDRLAALSPGRDILGLERIAELCRRLGDPQHRLPPVLHVAGTNGKGSTSAFLRAAIEAQGLSAHVYSSPHLVRFNERIRLAGTLIDDALLAALLAEVLDVADDLRASFFEVTTAAAFLAFARTPADACIVEVGLGGRLDATNIIATPAVCGIASLGIDHEAFLLAPEADVPALPNDRIAFEKAGIAKADAPLVTQAYPASMRAVIAARAGTVGARLVDRGAAWDAHVTDGRLRYRDARGTLDLPLPVMAGAHQADNAALAVAMLRHQDAIAVDDDALAAAVECGDWVSTDLLLRAGCDVDAEDGEQRSLLWRAAARGRPHLVRTLLRGGARTNATAPDGVTALGIAVRNGHLAAVQALLDGGTTLTCPPAAESALLVAAASRSYNIVRALVRFSGATRVVMWRPSRATTTEDSACSGMEISNSRVS